MALRESVKINAVKSVSVTKEFKDAKINYFLKPRCVGTRDFNI